MGLIGQSIDANGEKTTPIRTATGVMLHLRNNTHGRLYVREDGNPEEDYVCEWKHAEWNNIGGLSERIMERLLQRVATHPPNRSEAGNLRFITVEDMVFSLSMEDENLYATLIEKQAGKHLNVPINSPMVVATWQWTCLSEQIAADIMQQLWLAGESLSMDQEASLTAKGRL